MVGSPGSIVTRGLGSGLLVTRGYGTALVISIPEVTVDVSVPDPHGRRPEKDRLIREQEDVCITLTAQLVSVNSERIEGFKERKGSVHFTPGEMASARLVDVNVSVHESVLRLEAQLDSVSAASHGARVSASLPLIFEDREDVIVNAQVDSGTVHADDIVIHVGKLSVNSTGDEDE